MQLNLVSAHVSLDVFRDQCSSGFSRWALLPDCYLRCSIPIYRSYGSRSIGVYAAKLLDLNKSIRAELISGEIGAIADEALFRDFDEKGMAACWHDERCEEVFSRKRKKFRESAVRIMKEIDRRGGWGNPIGESSSVVFAVGRLKGVLCKMCAPDGIRFTLKIVDRDGDPEEAMFRNIAGHGLVYVDCYTDPNEEEIAAVITEININIQKVREALAHID